MKRLISLLPSTTEILFALGCEENLVGITHECDFPAATASIPRLTTARISPAMESVEIDWMVREQLEGAGTLYELDLDSVQRLQPDLVLTQQLCTVCAVGYDTVQRAMLSLENPPKVLNIEPRNLEEVFDCILLIGAMLGVDQRAGELVADLRARLDRIPPLERKPRILFLEWLIPPFSAGHWIPELVVHAGGVPVLDSAGTYSQEQTWELIEREDFDVLVVSCCGFDLDRVRRDVEGDEQLKRLRHHRPDLQTILFDGNHYFSRPGPRLVESAELLNCALRNIDPEIAGASVGHPWLVMQ